MTLRAMLVTALLASGSADVPPPSRSTVERTMDLLHEFSQAQDASWIQAHRDEITPDVARAGDLIAKDAFNRGEIAVGRAAALFAALAHQMLGERAPALESMINAQQAGFMLAERASEYAAVRRETLQLRQFAREIRRPDLEFRALVLAADSGYFQGNAEEGPEHDRAHLAALKDVASALPLAKTDTSAMWFERTVSLTSALVGDVTGRFHAEGGGEFTAALKAVAAAVEKAVPADFRFDKFEQQEAGNTGGKWIATAIELGQLSYRYGNPAAGNARFTAAEARVKGDQAAILNLLSTHYRLERSVHPRASSLPRMRAAALGHGDAFRRGYRSRVGRLFASFQMDRSYGDMVNDLFSAPDASDAARFSIAETLKARVLLDKLGAASVREIATPEARTLERTAIGWRAATQEATSLTMAEMRLASQLSGFLTIARNAEERLAAVEELEAGYRSDAAGFQSGASPSSLRDIQQALQPGEAIVEYLEPYHELGPTPDVWALLITRARTYVTHRRVQGTIGFTGRMSVDEEAPIDAGPLGDLVISTRTAIRTSNDRMAREHLRKLYDLLVQPLLDGVRLGEVTRLIVIPHGVLHYVPFAALLDGEGKFLIEKVAIAVSPSASVWRILASRSRAAGSWVAFSNPDVDGARPGALQFADQEVDGIAKRFPRSASVYPHGRATPAQLREVAPRAQILHFATHGKFPDDDALNLHSVLLADGKGSPSWLTASDVRGLDLSATYLVVLSVCNGGLYRIGPADEPYGLMPAFLEAGAQNVLGTLWPLEDQFGRDFMLEYYRHLSKGPAEAYRQASLRFIGEDELIHRWAAFVLMGPGRPASVDQLR